VDRDYVHRVRREYGVHVNPWASYPRLITSMDFLKREAPLKQFLDSLQGSGPSSRSVGTGIRDWDLLIIDEAHNVAPAGRDAYVRDSDRTHMVRQIMPHFEHRLFLTATPHNGYTVSFTAMLEMLDPLRFARCTEVNQDQLKKVMVRRIKDEMKDALGAPRFPKREVDALGVSLSPEEEELFGLLSQYTASRLGRSTSRDRLPVRFALTMLKKRLLSSVFAFRNSIAVHHAGLSPDDEEPEADRTALVQQLSLKVAEDFADDDEKEQAEETALSESATFFRLSDAERALVERIEELAVGLCEKPDSKLTVLLEWIERRMRPQGVWNDERLLLFTEYRHTLTYVEEAFVQKGWQDRYVVLYGGMGDKQREEVKAAFTSAPAANQVRILLATDAASEGLNLQAHCRHLIHYEVPWNPNKMEQRNGRIDRHGQRAAEVYCSHFAYEGQQDQEFLNVVVNKVKTQRADLGAVGEVIAAQVEEALLGERRRIEAPQKRWDTYKKELASQVQTEEQIRGLRQRVLDAREAWKLTGDSLRQVLDEALKLEGHSGLEPVASGDLAGKAWTLPRLPALWQDCGGWIRDDKGRLLSLVFDDQLARERKDVSLLHLDHPLTKRAIAVFRANMWSLGLHESHQMSRASYRVVKDSAMPEPAMVLVSRLVAVNTLGHKLHEEFLLTGGEIRGEEILFGALGADQDRLRGYMDLAGEHSPLPREVGSRLAMLFSLHEHALAARLREQAKAREKAVQKELRDRGTHEASEVRKLVDERIREVEKRIKEMEKALGSPQVWLPGFEREDLEQFGQDVGWLRGRAEQLKKDRSSEPDAVKARYELRGAPRCFPLALLYLLPRRYVSGVKS